MWPVIVNQDESQVILWYRRNDVFDENIGAIPEGDLLRMIMRNVSKPAALVEMLSNGQC